ncbi:hypothetical protein JXA88_10965 [Candidatus Fermentibacteria bacterium]|nr:hypothetical protein [Candidatus Fermentibacteria bacterium]
MTYRRREVLPHAFVELARSFGILELGCMSSAYRWDYETDIREGGGDRSGYIDTIKLGYAYAFSPTSRLQLSISHVAAIEEFGGGNAQFTMLF